MVNSLSCLDILHVVNRLHRQAVTSDPSKSCLVIVPRDSDARDTASALRVFGGPMAVHVNLHTSNTPNASSLVSRKGRSIDVVTPSALLSWLDASNRTAELDSLSLVLCDNLELLNDDYELAVSLLRQMTQTKPVRYVGITASLNDTLDLAQWLNVQLDNLYDFRPSDRDQILSTTSQPFTLPLSSALFKAMIKPAHGALRTLPDDEAGIVFVPSRGQCKIIANDLITECAIEMNTRGFIGEDVSVDMLEARLGRLKDRSLMDIMMQGIGIITPGTQASDRLLTLELFADGILRVLVVPREMCWTLPVRASLVIALGTQYYQVGPSLEDANSSKTRERDDRVLKEYTVHELVRIQGLAIRHGKVGRFHLLCQSEQRDTYMRFLEEGLPLESSLLQSPTASLSSSTSTEEGWTGSPSLLAFIARRRASGSIRGKQDAMDMLSHTFLWRRMKSNPTFYDVAYKDGENARHATLSRAVDKLFAATAPPEPEALKATTSTTAPPAKEEDNPST